MKNAQSIILNDIVLNNIRYADDSVLLEHTRGHYRRGDNRRLARSFKLRVGQVADSKQANRCDRLSKIWWKMNRTRSTLQILRLYA